MSLYKVYFYIRTTSITEEYDDDSDNYIPRESTTELVKCECFTDLRLAFAEEDGDGDDTGSWSKRVEFITNEKDVIVYNANSDFARDGREALIERMHYEFAEGMTVNGGQE